MGSVGGDSGGSIRIPAAFCGVTGVKPTYGRVGRSGEIPFSYSVGHLGPIARTVEDAAILLEPMAGYDPGDGASSKAEVPHYRRMLQRPSHARLADWRRVLSTWMRIGNEEDIASAFDAAVGVFRSFGCAVQDVMIPHLDSACATCCNCILRIEGFRTHFEHLRDKRNQSRAFISVEVHNVNN